jgi:alkylation response protein AidB-like acyl-CoA dehydrogenase
MDFRFTAQEEEFRKEVQQFLDEVLPPERPDGVKQPARVAEITRNYKQKLRERGWRTMAWPKEFGGQGRTIMELMRHG